MKLKSKKKIEIKEITENFNKFSEKKITINGWIKGLRSGKENFFLNLNDGSCLSSIQIFFSKSFSQREILEKLNFGSFVSVKGLLKLTPLRDQKFEIIAEEIIEYCKTSNDYPLQKKSLPISLIREYPQFKAKTMYFISMFKLRSNVSSLINTFFQKKKFHYINTPIITSNDSEGGGESFSVVDKKESSNFFCKKANLTVSGQLHAESITQGLGKVYNFSPCFRAEKSNTTRHLSEFWMVEAEAAFFDLKEIMKLAEGLIKYVIKGVLKKNKDELDFFEKFNDKEIIKDLEKTKKLKFKIISYTKCIDLLNKRKKEEENFSKFDEIHWGMDLKSEHEKYLCEYFGSPVFVINYPVEMKAFYMKNNEDKKTVSCMDLLLPKIGEVVGGSSRENKFETIKEKIKKMGLDEENLSWYTNMRKNGYAPSSGFGLGLERLLMFLSKIENIKDTVAFPRFPNSLQF